ncbi:hypothetical protein F5Y16DRAFT_4064 [Xylariaceae sp. FL0255]|nr:hypothetical protein F5Y16DRAFT_4064 [Xylariaceae sp. FL0255]
MRPRTDPGTTAPSATRVRLTTGIPNTRFDTGSQRSATVYKQELSDPYREAYAAGVPADSRFAREYASYKAKDDKAFDDLKHTYEKYLYSGPHATKKMRAKAPGAYAGDPPQTEAWHQTAAQHAAYVGNEFDEPAHDRREFMYDFIGYVTKTGGENTQYNGYEGHKDRVERLEKKSRHLDRKYDLHTNSHNPYSTRQDEQPLQVIKREFRPLRGL